MKFKLPVLWGDDWVEIDDVEENGEPKIEIDVSKETFSKVMVMQSLCRVHGLSEVKRFHNQSSWSSLTTQNTPIRPDCAQMHVSNGSVWWSCWIKHTDIQLRTERIYTLDFVESWRKDELHREIPVRLESIQETTPKE